MNTSLVHEEKRFQTETILISHFKQDKMWSMVQLFLSLWFFVSYSHHSCRMHHLIHTYLIPIILHISAAFFTCQLFQSIFQVNGCRYGNKLACRFSFDVFVLLKRHGKRACFLSNIHSSILSLASVSTLRINSFVRLAVHNRCNCLLYFPILTFNTIPI